MLQKSVKSLLLQAKRFSALSNWNRHIIVAPKVKGTDFSVPCFYVYFIKNATPLLLLDNDNVLFSLVGKPQKIQ